uniref:Growth arrest-specific 1b n=1 Tax=Myripristis murdjan TaxID=586833 RepID=A0A667YWE5_9TELE
FTGPIGHGGCSNLISPSLQPSVLRCSLSGRMREGRLCVGSPNHGGRLVCWQAIMKCQREPDCYYAYEQYLYACEPVIRGDVKKCPSHCISSLIQLNLTQNGPALEDCDCASDPLCRSTQRAIEPCLPRTRSMGCTEARTLCERDLPCSSAMRDYLYHCRKLFGGERCSDGCRRVIANMRSIPKAQQLDTCVCDGIDRNICEYIKVSMNTFCFDSNDRFAGSGFSDSEEDSEDDYFDSEDYQYVENSSDSPPCPTVLNVVTTILVLTKFI